MRHDVEERILAAVPTVRPQDHVDARPGGQVGHAVIEQGRGGLAHQMSIAPNRRPARRGQKEAEVQAPRKQEHPGSLMADHERASDHTPKPKKPRRSHPARRPRPAPRGNQSSPRVCFWRSLDQRRLAAEVLYCWMQSEDFRSQVLAVAGQTDMAPYVSLRDQRQMDVSLFPDTHRTIADQMKPLFDRQALLAAETKALVSLRDGLLPRLLSGELSVSTAERVLEAQA